MYDKDGYYKRFDLKEFISEHKETYDVFGTDEKGKEHRYYISKSDWEDIEVGGKIKYKRHRFGDKIFEIEFC